LWHWLAETLLLLVFVGSVLNQLPIRRWERLVLRFDPWALLPYWSFFAPNPGHTGTHLIFRDREEAGWSPWTDIAVPGSNGWRWVWNPGRFERKALQDMLAGLARTARALDEPTALQLTACHLALMTWVDTQPDLLGSSTHRQFAVIQTQGHGPNRSTRPVFVSKPYKRD
jgi:hypothetical protein